jgi:type I restriction enzyme, S subunit
MNRYQNYKNSEIDWVGVIPSHWETVKPQYKLNRVTRPIDADDEVVTCFRDGVVTLRKNRRESGFTNSIQEHGYQQIRPGDLVVHEMDGFAGAIGISDSKGKSTPVYTVIEPDQKVDLRYITYLLREMSKTGKIESLARSIRERTTDFRWNMWSVIHFPFPPVDEQKLISRYLDKNTSQIDWLIEKVKKKIELLKEQRTSLINQCITKGLNPNVEMKDSGVKWIGDIPKHWEIKPIRSVLQKRNEKNDPIIETNILSLTADRGVIPYAEKGNAGNRSKEDLSQYKIARIGDIVVNSMNIISGSVGLSSYVGLVSPVYYMLRPIHKIDIVEYFYYIFKDQSFQLSLFGLGNGILVKQSESSGKFNTVRLRIPLTKLLSVKIPYAPPSEQEKVSSHIIDLYQRYEKMFSKEQRRISLLDEYRHSLISSVVTGKVRVTEEMV